MFNRGRLLVTNMANTQTPDFDNMTDDEIIAFFDEIEAVETHKWGITDLLEDEELDWTDERSDAEVAVNIAREAYMFACPDTCDALQEAYHDAQKALAAVLRKEAGE